MVENLFVSGGEFGALVRSHDWSQTPLGAVETWSDDLKTAVQILLSEIDRSQQSSNLPQNDSGAAALQQADKLNAFRIKLADALRPRTDASEIQAIAARILGESLGATRVIYIEVVSGGEEVIVHCNYTNGVAELSGRYRLEDYRRNLTTDHQAGHTQIVTDIPNNPKYTDAQKTRYREIDIAAHIDVPLIKNNLFVALLAVHQSTPRQWTQTEVKLAQETAEQTWAAVERAHAEAALRESEAKYRTLFESIDQGFCVIEVLFDADSKPCDYRFLEINPAFEKQTGLFNAQGKRILELAPTHETYWFEIYGKIALTGEPIRFENRAAALHRWYDVYAFRIGHPEERKVAVLFNDISDRKQAELNAEFLATITQNLIEATSVGEILQTVGEQLNRYLKTSSCAFIEINERADEAAILQDWHQENVPSLIGVYQLPEFVTDDFFQIAKAGNPIVVEDVFTDARIADPQRFAALNIGSFINVPLIRSGEWKFTLGAYHQERYDWRSDEIELMRELANRIWTMLERARAEAALRESEAKYRTLFETMDQGFGIAEILVDDAGHPIDYRMLELNPQFERLMGQQREMFLTGKTVREVAPELEEEWYEFYGTVGLTGIPAHREIHAEAWGRWFEVSAYRTGAPQQRRVAILFAEITKRKQTEQALRQSEESFRAVANLVPDLLWDSEPDGCSNWYNQRWLEYTGQPFEQALGWGWTEVIHPSDRARSAQLYREAVETGMPLRQEHRIRRHDGEYHWFVVNALPLKDDSGKVIKMYGAATDIHEQRTALEALRESEERLQKAISIETVGVLFFYLNGQISDANDAVLRMSGYSRDELLNMRNWRVLTAPEFWEVTACTAEELATRGETAPYEKQMVRQDGSRWWGLFSPTRLQGSGWNAECVEFIIDISDRKRAEASLQESEARYRLLAEAIPQFVWITDAEGENEYVNQRFCDYTGLTAEHLLGLNWLSIVHPEDLEMTCDRWLTAVHTGQFYQVESRLRARDGSYRWFLCQGIPLKDEQGCVHQWFGTCTDIESQKQIEQARLRLLEQEQIARERAENANRIKDEFLAVLSHELRSPLNPILGWSRLLQNGKLDEARKTEALKTIERNAKLQTQLIEDLLDISRIMQGKLSLTAAPVSLTFVISAAMETVRLAAEAKQIRLKLDFDNTVAPISGDAARLQQVFWNLLSNAVKFTPPGGQVTVELRQVNQFVEIRVIDTGKGINPQFLPYVFEYFRQEDGSTTRKFGGLGLGLAIARQIVELHGGNVWAESQGEGHGATFIVQLPAMRVEPIVSEAVEIQTDAVLPLEGIHILLVDDEPDTREFQAFILEQSGARVTAVASAPDALQALEQSIPDVLVSDIGMAQMDGYMLLEQIRSRPTEQGGMIPAIALTAYAAEIDRHRALQVGFQTHITKPMEPEVLVRAIANLFSKP